MGARETLPAEVLRDTITVLGVLDGQLRVLRAERDRAVSLLREAVVAERIDSDMLGHAALAGDSALGAWFALSVDPFLAELDGDPYFTSPR